MEVIEDHVLTQVVHPSITDDAARAKGAEELVEVLRAYLR
jgi:FrmR/RcnR family transcriptional regulator, repressor of frmRAB operon